MPRRIGYQKAGRRPIFVRQWREFRGLSQEQLADRLDMSAAQLSRIESGKQPYTQDFLEAAAHALRTDVASLLMRDPSKEDPNDPDSIWSLWDRAKPGEKRQIVGVSRAILNKTGTE
jgi:transcriptional regulator with XRE-family HTH domain